MDQAAQAKSSTGKTIAISCLIAVGALVTVGIMAVLAGVFFLSGSSSSSSPYVYSVGSEDESLDEFVPVEPENGPPPDFFDDLNEVDDDDK